MKSKRAIALTGIEPPPKLPEPTRQISDKAPFVNVNGLRAAVQVAVSAHWAQHNHAPTTVYLGIEQLRQLSEILDNDLGRPMHALLPVNLSLLGMRVVQTMDESYLGVL